MCRWVDFLIPSVSGADWSTDAHDPIDKVETVGRTGKLVLHLPPRCVASIETLCSARAGGARADSRSRGAEIASALVR